MPKFARVSSVKTRTNRFLPISGEHVDDAATESAVADHVAAERVEHGQVAVAAAGAEGAVGRRDDHQLDGGAGRGDDGRLGAAGAAGRRLRRRAERGAAAPRGAHAATSAGASGS